MNNDIFVDEQITEQNIAPENPMNFGVYMKPTPKGEYYRFRLLWFKDETDRKTPFVTRFVHEYWEDMGEGPNRNHSIVCPTSIFVRNNWKGDAFKDCPICRFSGNNFISWRDSGYIDKIASKNYRGFKRKFQAIIPVYVINDPNYEPNNGKLKVLIINESDIFNKFKKSVINKNKNTAIFNGGEAVDFLVRSEQDEKVFNEGEDNEYRFFKTEIVQMGFSNKPYKIPAINKEAVDQFPFAQVYYTASTLNELKSFYKKWCLHTITDDIDDSDMSDLSDMDNEELNFDNSEEIAEIESNIENEEISDIKEKEKDKGKKNKENKSEKIDDSEASEDSIIDDILDDSNEIFEGEEEVIDSDQSSEDSKDEEEIDIDSLLDDIGI